MILHCLAPKKNKNQKSSEIHVIAYNALEAQLLLYILLLTTSKKLQN